MRVPAVLASLGDGAEMSAWIKSYQALRDHPKTRKLARRVGGLPAAIGYLHCLWWWCVDYAPDGDLTKHDAEDIAIACEWDGKPADLIKHLSECGFLDNGSGLHVHDWEEYGGKWLDQQGKHATRNRDMREAYADGTVDAVRDRDGNRCRYCSKTVDWMDRRGPDGATYDHVDPSGPTTVDNLVVCCRSCNAKKGDKTLGKSGFRLTQVGPRSVSAADLLDRKIDRKKDLTENRPVDNSTVRPVSAKELTCWRCNETITGDEVLDDKCVMSRRGTRHKDCNREVTP